MGRGSGVVPRAVVFGLVTFPAITLWDNCGAGIWGSPTGGGVRGEIASSMWSGDISGNNIWGNYGAGIWGNISSGMWGGDISGNSSWGNIGAGIWRSVNSGMWGGDISGNSIWGNIGAGMWGEGLVNISFSSNDIWGNEDPGITLKNSSNNTLSNNILYNNTKGINLDDSTNNSRVQENDFIKNKVQAHDDGSSNRFINNFWDDWISPDENEDGIVDNPRSIVGEANNQDPYPRTVLNNPNSMIHSLLKPEILYPNGSEVVNRNVMIQWTPVHDSFVDATTYEVYYSADGGTNWNEIATNLATTSFTWDTTTVNDGSTYLIKVVATCEEFLTAEDISDRYFTIQNRLTIPTPFMELHVVLFALSIILLDYRRKRSKKYQHQ
ncbi:MAG: right-handed parallel beta-helix repeat-containing protein [Promethearchaeota archaeon]